MESIMYMGYKPTSTNRAKHCVYSLSLRHTVWSPTGLSAGDFD